MKYDISPSDIGERCILISLDLAAVPLIAGRLDALTSAWLWQDDEAYEVGYNLICGVLSAMGNDCSTKIVESVDRLYRLLDTNLAGTQYSVVSQAPPLPDLILPPIPAVPSITSISPGIRKILADIPGTLDAGWFGGGRSTTLADIVEALRIGSDPERQALETTLSEILASGGSLATMGDSLIDLLGNVVGTGAEGSLMGVLIASSLVNASVSEAIFSRLGNMLTQAELTAQAQAAAVAELSSVVQALRGADAPSDNILLALRGSTPASSSRNLLDGLAAAGVDPALIDELESLLGTIVGQLQ